MNGSTNKLSPAIQALIAGALLLMFAGVLFLCLRRLTRSRPTSSKRYSLW